MAIQITTNDNATGYVTQNFSSHKEARENKATVEPEQAVHNDADAVIDEENKPGDSATQENVDNSLSYLEENNDNEENDEEDVDDDDLDIEENTEKTKKNGFQKRINKLTKEKSELSKRLADLEAKFNSLGNDKPATATNNAQAEVKTDLKEPILEDFDDYAKFIEAKTEYNVKLEMQKIKLAEEQRKVEEESQKILKSFQEKAQKAEQRYGAKAWQDLKDNEHTLNYSNIVRGEIITSEYGPDILYYLHKNREECKKINEMTPSKQIKEIGKIEDKIAQALTKPKTSGKVSTAPAPIKAIDGKATTASKKVDDMSLSEYRKWRNKK